MSDLRITSTCVDCPEWNSGTSTLERAGEHVDIYPDHRIVLTRSGDLSEWTNERASS